MVAWSWSEFAVNGIKDSPKKEAEILIKMFHIIMSYDSLLLIKRKWMGNIVYLLSWNMIRNSKLQTLSVKHIKWK